MKKQFVYLLNNILFKGNKEFNCKIINSNDIYWFKIKKKIINMKSHKTFSLNKLISPIIIQNNENEKKNESPSTEKKILIRPIFKPQPLNKKKKKEKKCIKKKNLLIIFLIN